MIANTTTEENVSRHSLSLGVDPSHIGYDVITAFLIRTVGCIITTLQVAAIIKHYQLRYPHFGLLLLPMSADYILLLVSAIKMLTFSFGFKWIAKGPCGLLRIPTTAGRLVAQASPSLLAIEQYIFICWPFIYQRWMQNRKVAICGAVLWALSVTIATLLAYNPDNGNIECAITSTRRIFYGLFFGLSALSLLAILFSMFCVSKAIKTQVQNGFQSDYKSKMKMIMLMSMTTMVMET